MASQTHQAMQNGKNIAKQAKAGFNEAKDAVKSKAQDLKEGVEEQMAGSEFSDMADQLTGTLKKSFGEISTQVEEQFGEVKQTAEKYVNVLTEYYKEHPVRMLVSAVGIGIVLGRVLSAKPMIAKK